MEDADEWRAEDIKAAVIEAVADWRNTAAKYKISPSEIEQKANAFRF